MSLLTEDFKIGDEVVALVTIYEPPCSELPGGLLCKKGDRLFIRNIKKESQQPISVSHKDILDCSFKVDLHEIEIKKF